MKIGCIQTKASDLHEFENTASMILRRIDEAASMKCELMVFPECVYPSYYVGTDEDVFLDSMKRLVFLKQEISERARKYHVYIAAGMMDNSSGKTSNKGILWGPDGEVAAEVAKSNMWHFDRKYAFPGKEYQVFETSFGKAGLIVCADGRAPEICRILALKGARIIIDMANLVTSGKDLSRVTNPQIDYMLPSRARENGVWLVLADKVGLEAGTVLNSGGSSIINPMGQVIARASADREEILTCDIDPFSEKDRPELPPREPWRYSIIAEPTEKLPVTENMLSSSTCCRTSEVFVSVVDFIFSDRESYLDQAFFFLETLEDQDSELICLPSFPIEWGVEDLLLTAAESLVNDGTLVFAGIHDKKNTIREAALFSRNGVMARYSPSGDRDDLPVFDTLLGRIGVCIDRDVLVPEVIRCMMLEGVFLVICADTSFEGITESVSRTRASENRIFLARLKSREHGDNSYIVNPGGQIIASTAPGMNQAASALVNPLMAFSKTVIPGTNVVLGRRPELYGELVIQRSTER